MGQVSVYNLSGAGGSLYVNDTAAHAGNFFAVQCTEETVFADLTGNMENESALISDATAFAAGTVIYGRFSSIDLTSGAVIAYRA
jgi:hypothetical protein